MNIAAASRSLSPSRLVRALMRRFDGDRGGARQRRTSSDAPRTTFALEALEPRLLLDAVLEYTMVGDQDVVVEVVLSNLQVKDITTSTVLASQAANVTNGVRLHGGNGDNLVVIDYDIPFDAYVQVVDTTITDDDRLAVFGPDDLVWDVTGLGTGFVHTAGGLSFSGIEELQGDTGNRDRFNLGLGGAVKQIDANSVGFDTLLVESNTPVTLTDLLYTDGAGRSIVLDDFESAVVEATTLTSNAFTGQVARVQGLPTWTSEGPGALDGGQAKLPGADYVAGAVQDVVVRPFDLASLYIGTVGGGVWKNSDISVQFAADQSTLAATAQQRLAAFADFLIANPTLPVQVVGHTSAAGDPTAPDDQVLSVARANAVKQYLLDHGIATGRLVVSGKADTAPVDTDGSPTGQANNRRVELLVNHWIPLTQEQPSLAISALTISPLDANGAAVTAATPTSKLVIYAGTGATSNGGTLLNNVGTIAAVGVFKSTDGGTTWSLLPDFAGNRIHSILALANGNLLVSTEAANNSNGLFLSTNGGQSFTDVAVALRADGIDNDNDGVMDAADADEGFFAQRAVTDLVQDPGNPARVYAGVAGRGIFVTTDSGVTWSPAGNAALATAAGNSLGRVSRVIMAVSPQLDGGPNHPLYAALITNTQPITAGAAAGTLTVEVSANTVLEARDRDVWVFGGANDGVDNDNNGQTDEANESKLVERMRVVNVSAATVAGKRTVTLAAPGNDGVDNDRDKKVDEADEQARTGLRYRWGVGALLQTVGGQTLQAVLRSDDLGATWTALPMPGTQEVTEGFLGIHTGAQAGTNFSMLVDPLNPDSIYVAGDRQPLTSNNTIGATDFTGRLFRFDGANWMAVTDTGDLAVVGDGANGTAPHADSRNAVFRGRHLVEVDDGGIYELRNAAEATREWRSLNDDLGLAEFYKVAYDPLTDVIAGGTQDIGSGLQSPLDPMDWSALRLGDGAYVAFDGGDPIYSGPDLGGFTIERVNILNDPALNGTVLVVPQGTNVAVSDTVDIGPTSVYTVTDVAPAGGAFPAGSLSVTLNAGLADDLAVGAPGLIRPALDVKGTTAAIANARFTTPFITNDVVAGRLLIGTTSVYESTDLGRTLSLLRTTTGSASTNIGEVRAMVYGGRQSDTDRPNVIWAGTDPGSDSTPAANRHALWLRGATGAVGGKLAPVKSYTSEVKTAVLDIAVDPEDWRRVFVLDAEGHIWYSPNAGTAKVFDANGNAGSQKFWKRMDSSLPSFIEQIEMTRVNGVDVLLVAGQGGVYRRVGDSPWHAYGEGLPNALGSSLDLIGGTDDLLLLGTFGRGAWSLQNASQSLATPTTLTLRGTDGDDSIVLRRNAAEPWLLDVFQYATGPQPTQPVYSVPFAALTEISIDVSGQGVDKVVLDASRGALAIGKISVLGGGTPGSNALTLLHDQTVSSFVWVDNLEGTFADGSQASAITDAYGGVERQEVSWKFMDNVTTTLAQPKVAGVADAIRSFADALAGGLTDTLRGQQLPGIDAQSLAGAMNGVVMESVRAKDASLVATSKVPGSGQVQIDNASSVLLRLLQAGGLDLEAFASGAITDPLLFEAALEALDGNAGNNSASFALGDLSYDIDGGDDYLFKVKAEDLVLSGVVDLDVLAGAFDVEMTGVLDVSMTLDLSLAFGFDSNGFFIVTDDVLFPSKITLTGLQVSGEAAGVGSIGFLGVDISKASLTLEQGVAIAFTLQDLGPTDGVIRVPEFLDAAPGALLGFGVTGQPNGTPDLVLDATIDVSALLPGLDGAIDLATANVKLSWANIAQSLDFGIAAGLDAGADVDEFLRFLDLGSHDIVDRLTTLRDSLEGIFGAEIPYLSDSVTEIVDLITAFQNKVLNPLTGDLDFELPSIQDLIVNLAEGLGITPDQLGLGYDKSSHELTYHLVLSEELLSATKQLGAGVDLGGLADLEFNTDATVGATVTLDTILGVDLDNILGDPRDWFFLKNASATATATIAASDIEASARFGFLSIGVDEGSLTDDDGVGPAEVSLTVQLLDPDTGLPGRVDLREILGNLGNLGDLIDVSGAGKLKLMLPVEFQTPLPGVALPDIPDGNPGGLIDLPARSLVVTIPDLSDTGTYGIALGSSLTSIDLGNFGNIDAASVVGVLGQLTYWLDQFRQSEAFANFDVPLVGPALDEALQLADGFRDLVLLDDKDTGLDNAKTLLADLNAALEGAGLGRKLFAANVGGNIALIATDASITFFTVAGATALGFGASQNGTKCLAASSLPRPWPAVPSAMPTGNLGNGGDLVVHRDDRQQDLHGRSRQVHHGQQREDRRRPLEADQRRQRTDLRHRAADGAAPDRRLRRQLPGPDLRRGYRLAELLARPVAGVRQPEPAVCIRPREHLAP